MQGVDINQTETKKKYKVNLKRGVTTKRGRITNTSIRTNKKRKKRISTKKWNIN